MTSFLSLGCLVNGNGRQCDLIDSMTCKKCNTANGYIFLQIKVKLLFNKGKTKGISNLNVW